jgi:ferredoxin
MSGRHVRTSWKALGRPASTDSARARAAGVKAFPSMTYVIAGSCIKDDACLDVCPVDCIHPLRGESGFETAEQLYIDPATCVDCDACVEVCPVTAIFPGDEVPEKWRHSLEVNADFFGRR